MFRETAEAPIGEALPKVSPHERSLQGFVAFLELTPEKEFDWNNCQECAIAQWWHFLNTNSFQSGSPYLQARAILGDNVALAVRKSCNRSGLDHHLFGDFGLTAQALRNAQL